MHYDTLRKAIMAHEHSRRDEGHKRARAIQYHDRHPADAQKSATPGSVLAHPNLLVANARLSGRGNAPVQTALLQQMQQTYGNRAVRHFLQRSITSTIRKTAIQKDPETPTKEVTELEFSPDHIGATIYTHDYKGEGKEALVRRAIELYLREYSTYLREYNKHESGENREDGAANVREVLEWYLSTDMLDTITGSLMPSAKEPVLGQRYSFRIDNSIVFYFVMTGDQKPLGKTEEDPWRRETKPSAPTGTGTKPDPTGKGTKGTGTKPAPTPKATKPAPKLPGKVLDKPKQGTLPAPSGGTGQKAKEEASTKEKLLKLAETAVDLATDFIPGISNLKDAHTCVRGKNAVTGEEVGGFGRALSCIFAIPGLGNIAKYVGKGLKLLGKGLLKGGKYLGKGLAAAWKWGKGKIAAAGKWLSERIVEGAKGLLNRLKGAWDWLKKKLGFGGKKAAKKAALKIPQGLTEEQFKRLSAKVRAEAGHLGNDIQVHGSRAAGAAKATSDLDLAIRVSDDQFKKHVADMFGKPNPGSAAERTMQHAIKTGKIQRGEAGLRKLGKELEAELGMAVDISVIRVGGPFDNGPWIPLL